MSSRNLEETVKKEEPTTGAGNVRELLSHSGFLGQTSL